MSLWIALAISVAAAAWSAPGLWRDFQAGIILPGSAAIKRDKRPILYWFVFTIQAALMLAWAAAVVALTLALSRGDIPS